MNSGYYARWADCTRAVYEAALSELQSYEVDVLGYKLIVNPGVFSPKYCANSAYFADYLRKIAVGKSLLDMGTGAGVAAVICALEGAKRVVATDINVEAVENCRINVKAYELSNVRVRQGDLFGPIPTHSWFDLIYWNHPFNYTSEPVRHPMFMAGFDYKYKSIRKFIREAKKHLLPDGKVILGSGSFAREDIILKTAMREGYSVRVVARENTALWQNRDDKAELIIYEMTQR